MMLQRVDQRHDEDQEHDRMTNRDWATKRFELLLPLATRWASKQERRILNQGVALTAVEQEDATAVGVIDPGRVRLLPVKMVPWPAASVLRAACKAIGFKIGETCGLSLGYGIFIREDCWRQRPLVVHELVHTAQYERFGGIEPFLRRYLAECLTVGYEAAPLEREAAQMTSQLLWKP